MADRRLTEAGDFRLTEAGDKRLVEGFFTHGPSDTVSLSENLATLKFTTFQQALGDTVALSESLQRQARKLLAEGFTPSEVLATLTDPFDFQDALVVAPVINGGIYTFRDHVRVVQGALEDFTDTLVTVGALADFSDHLRTLPDTQTPFAQDIQRPVGRLTSS
jgi:hypothetical protein